jgi:hypothetical protein
VLGRDGQVLCLERFGQRSDAGLGRLRQAQQNAKDQGAIQRRRQRKRVGRDRRRRLPGRLLLSAAFRVDGGEDDLSPQSERGDGLLAQQKAEVVVDARMHLALQFRPGEPRGRVVDQETQGRGQLAMSGKASAPGDPQAGVVEARRGGKGDEGGVVIEAPVTADLAQEALQGLAGQLQLLG